MMHDQIELYGRLQDANPRTRNNHGHVMTTKNDLLQIHIILHRLAVRHDYDLTEYRKLYSFARIDMPKEYHLKAIRCLMSLLKDGKA